jgi:hypothetical protein
MPEIKKPTYPSYEDAGPDARAKMDPLVRELENARWSGEAVDGYGAQARKEFHGIVKAIEKFLEDPTSPEADQSIADGLRDRYLEAAGNLAMTLSAGEEVLRRYDSEYLEQAADELVMAAHDGKDQEPAQQQITTLCKRRDELHERLKALAQPEKSHDYVCTAIGKLETGRQLSASINRGLPLEEPVAVRAPLRLVKRMTP